MYCLIHENCSQYLPSAFSYRLRLIHVGSAAQIRFSVDYHPLTLIEADGTLLEPYTVTGVSLDVAQRYSVLLTTNQTAGNGTYWMRMGLTSPLTVTGTNTDIRGVITYVFASVCAEQNC